MIKAYKSCVGCILASYCCFDTPKAQRMPNIWIKHFCFK